MSLEDVQEVYQDCTGLEWTHLHGFYRIDLTGMSASGLRRAAFCKKRKYPFCQMWREERARDIIVEDADEVLERDMLDAADFLDDVAADAATSEGYGKKAMEWAESGDCNAALEWAEKAARKEREYGDDPVWDQLVQAIEEEIVRQEEAEVTNQETV